MKKHRVLVLMDVDLVPPEDPEKHSPEEQLNWKTEYDVLTTLNDMGHDARALGVSDDLGLMRKAILEFKPHVAFNLLEEFHGVATYDQHIAAYLELMRQPYTGCNPRGLMLAHDKALSKKILHFHRIPNPQFTVFPKNRIVRRPRRLEFPLLVKSVIEEASLGITRDSIVRSDQQLADRVAYIHEELRTDALVEQFIEGRELYVGVIGNRRLTTFPIWEMIFKKLPDDVPNIATARVKWDVDYQKKIGLETRAARNIPQPLERSIQRLCKRIFRVLSLSGYARMDLRLTADGRVYVLEANPNPNLTYGEDFAESAETVGVSYEQLLQRICNLGLTYQPEWRLWES